MQTLGDIYQTQIHKSYPKNSAGKGSGIKTRSKVTFKLDDKVEDSNCSVTYAEITYPSMRKVLDTFRDEGAMQEHSVFMDVGSGLGKMVFVAALEY
jgi:hypothetical protein